MQNKITIEECQKLLEQNPFGSLLQMKITEAELGRVKAELPFKKEFTNIYGDLHGGVLYSAVDTICGIAAVSYTHLGALLVVGIMAHIAIQVILNIAVVTNSIPNTGITLPFISYGGTSASFLLAEMGLALSVSRGIQLEG